LHHIYADTEILSARSLIILSMARWISTRLPNTRLPIPFCHCLSNEYRRLLFNNQYAFDCSFSN
jgi:hypothetical protein